MDAFHNTGQLLLLVPLTQRVSPAGGVEHAGLGLCTDTGLELHGTDAVVAVLLQLAHHRDP